MNIYTVRDNLKNTIAGKEQYLAECEKTMVYYEAGQCESAMVQISIMIDMLKINIGELKRILQDVEQCCKKATEQSWLANPDRMGGASTPEDFEQYKWK